MIYIFCRVIDILFMFLFFFFNDTATTEIYTLSLHDALPIFQAWLIEHCGRIGADLRRAGKNGLRGIARFADADTDRKSTRLNSSHGYISYAVFCLKKKKKNTKNQYIYQESAYDTQQ